MLSLVHNNIKRTYVYRLNVTKFIKNHEYIKINNINLKFRYSTSQQQTIDKNNSEKLDLDTLSLSKKTISVLNSKNISSLFSIQKHCFPHILNNKDLVARARTGTGKTLAFALPIIESILKMDRRSINPTVLILTPTRELAKQVHSEVSFVSANRLSSVCIYGGVDYSPQAFKAGVDVIIGTPGRIKDHLDKGNLFLGDIKTLVLDEADYMLDIGFAQDLDQILNILKNHKAKKLGCDKITDLNDGDSRVQFLLFSATIPKWLKDTVTKYLRKDYVMVDLIGDEKLKSATTITQFAIPTTSSQIYDTVSKLMEYHYERNPKTKIVIFNETKRGCTEMSLHLKSTHKITYDALHGDVSQSQRERIMYSFKHKDLNCIVATDVAARGLDIPNVDAVIHSTVPQCHETYIHRTGRTGRAGKVGVSYLLFDPNFELRNIKNIETNVGLKFKRILTPCINDDTQFEDYVNKICSNVKNINPLLYKKFHDYIQANINLYDELLSLPPSELLASALACVSSSSGNISDYKSRSLITARDGLVTVISSSNNYHQKYKNIAHNTRYTISDNKVVFDIDESGSKNMLENDPQLEKVEELPQINESHEVMYQDQHTSKKASRRGSSINKSRYNKNYNFKA